MWGCAWRRRCIKPHSCKLLFLLCNFELFIPHSFERSMSATFDDYRPRRDGVTIPTIAIWIVVSLLAHVALLLGIPRFQKQKTEEPVPPPLTAYLRAAPQQPAPPLPQTPPRATPPPPKAARPPLPKPPSTVIALKSTPVERPATFAVPRPEPPPLAQVPQVTVAPPTEPDLSAYIETRRRARGEAPADASAANNANRGVLSSAALKQSPPMTFDSRPPTPSGGVFQIRRRGYDYAEFMFYGWNQNYRRAVPQMIEVRKGGNTDIDIAVIRKIIEIIRDYEAGDFSWYSKRSGKSLTLSARARDNSGLEDFMMQEFYEELHRYR
jgi:hypothetical protein